MSEQQPEQEQQEQEEQPEMNVVCSGGFKLPPLNIRFGEPDGK